MRDSDNDTKKLHGNFPEQLNKGYPGSVSTKTLAPSHVGQPGLNYDIENCMKACKPCQENRNFSPKPPYTPRNGSQRPPQKWLHIDFAGPVRRKTLLIVLTNTHSKWPEVFTMTTTTLSNTIALPHNSLSRFGLYQSRSSQLIDYTNRRRLKRQTNGDAITVYGQKLMLDNSIEKDRIT